MENQHQISLTEAKVKRGDCERCRKDSVCRAWWKKDIEQGGALIVCVKRHDPYYLS